MEHILFFLLLGFQHSESVFHAVVSHLPAVLRALATDSEAFTVLSRLGETAHFLMARFPDFPELYNPVEEVLAELKIEPPKEDRMLGKTFQVLGVQISHVNKP